MLGWNILLDVAAVLLTARDRILAGQSRRGRLCMTLEMPSILAGVTYLPSWQCLVLRVSTSGLTGA